jgi:hypothetical protein
VLGRPGRFRDNVEKLFSLIRKQAAWATIAAAVSVIAQGVEKLPV